MIRGIMQIISKIPNVNCIILDAISILNGITAENILYDKENCSIGIEKLTEIYQQSLQTPTTSTTVCMIVGISNLLSRMDINTKAKFTAMIEKTYKTNMVKYIFVETIDNIKSINFEMWYKSGVDLSEGIWIGNGLANQFTLKVTTSARILRAEIEPNFGYIIRKGKATLIKFISDE